MYLILIALFLVALYFYSKRNHKYWKNRGVKYEEPMLFFGGTLKQYSDKVSFSGRFANMYKQYPDEKFVGFYEGNKPGILIRDPYMIKYVLLNDFRNFHIRGANYHREIKENLLKNLFNVDGDIWKLMRQKLTPTFSSAKLKAMFPLIVERTENLLKLADGFAKSEQEVDVRELMARYTTDFIGACGFGIDADTLNDENSEFRKLGKRIFTFTAREVIINILKLMAPNLFKNLHFLAPEIEEQTVGLVKQIMAQRNYEPSGRNDFIDLMLELRKKSKIVGESIEKYNPDGSYATVELEIDDLLIAAQVFIFFAAGFETSSSASSFLLHMLAYHPEEQERCQQEIDEVLKKHGGKLSFDAVKEMKYLEMAFKESLRIFPSPGFLMRRNAHRYTFPDTTLTIEPDTIVIISLEGMHHDEQYFEDPEEFKPMRFHPDNIDNINKNVYMPFGDGLRSCIGARLGQMQSMAGAAAVLSRFSVAPSKNSIKKPIVDHRSDIIQTIVGGLPLTLKRRLNTESKRGFL